MTDNARKAKMLLDLIDVIDDNITVEDIVNALRQVEKARERRRRQYKPTGRPRGRQKKDPMIYTGDL